MTMSRRLPPLNALRSFEAAARCLSFTQAAAELHVTPSAVSHQVKLMEDDLGTRLFRRDNNRLLLTEAGMYLLPRCTAIFEQLSDLAQGVRGMNAPRPLNLSLRPYFAQKWLLPRLADFWKRYPQIDVSLHHSIQPPTFASDQFDLAVVWGDGQFPGLEARLLVNGDLIPVCHPSILGGARTVSPEVLAEHVLLDEEAPHNWDRWLEAAGAAHVKPRRRISIDDTNVRLHAAIDRQGFMLTCLSMIERELKEGILIAPFRTALPHYGYYLVYRKDAETKDGVRTFVEWIVAQASGSPA